jgi:ubiquinone/menaquinone biosynthesis C-methylase UbiE
MGHEGEDEMTNAVSRFIRRDDPRVEQMIFRLPSAWWSRPYEYAWAQNFIRSTDVVLDAACGISHPFKLWLVDHAAEVHACDNDERILSSEAIRRDIVNDFGESALDLLNGRLEQICYARADLRLLPYSEDTFDRVFCISVLEHLDQAARTIALNEMGRVLKPNGQMLLTFDVPDLEPNELTSLLSKSSLAIDGLLDTWRFGDSITSSMWGSPLYCFRAVVRKL